MSQEVVWQGKRKGMGGKGEGGLACTDAAEGGGRGGDRAGGSVVVVQ